MMWKAKRSGQACARRYHQEHDKEYYARPEVKARRKLRREELKKERMGKIT